MAFYRRSGRPDAYGCNESYEVEGYGCGDQGQLVRPCPPKPSHSFLGAAAQHARVLPQGRTVKVTCKGNTDFALGVRDGQVVMVYSDPNDPTQQWIKDDSWCRSVRDSVGHPAFCLVNKATGKALRHAPGAYQQVLLTNYEPGSYDESVMWSQSEDMGEGFKTIRMAHNILLNLDCFQGDIKHGGIKEGNECVLWTWNRQDNQLWKINPIY
ncbi:ricin B-like lectin R40G3 [Nymphaea colorata]|nr:ricin B-like lectin R40G3 [Nymphaea colorata]